MPANLIWQQAAANTANTALGIGMQRIGANYDRRQQLRTQDALMGMQLNYNKEMLDYENQQNLALYSPEQQKQRLKEAGLNPGLMYGMSGAGGLTQGSAPNVSAPQAGIRDTSPPMELGINVAQLKMLQAQIDNINADTENKKAENPNIPKQGANIEANTANLLQGVQNQKAVEELTKINTRIQQIDEWIKGRSKQDQADLIMWQSEKALNEVELLWRQNLINKATMDDKIDLVKTELAQKLLQNELIKAKTITEKGKPAVQSAEIAGIQQQIVASIRSGVQKWRELELTGQHMSTEQRKQAMDEWVNDVQNSTHLPTDILEKVAQAIIFKNLISPPNRNEVGGFHKR